MPVKLFVATKAFIEHNGKVLILRESTQYEEGTNVAKYDVPGGRLEPGQHFMDSLKREIEEETGLSEVEVGGPIFVNEWRPKKGNEEWQIVGIFFRCSSSDSKITLSDDHDDYIWINPMDYSEHNLIPNLRRAFEAYLSN